MLWRRRWSKLSYRYADTYIAAVYADTYIAADIDMRTHIAAELSRRWSKL